MDELDLFRDFRRGVAAPNSDERRRASARLATAVHDRRARAGRGYRVAFVLAAVAAAAVAALVVSTPWNGLTGFLQRAQAALAPQPATILHQKWVIRTTATDPACNVTIRGETWIDQRAPHRYRAVLSSASGPARACRVMSTTTGEFGGVPGSPQQTLRFVPPNTLTASAVRLAFPIDPVSDLRDAISAGRAHDEGRTQLDGRTVERIRLDPPPDCPLPAPVPGYPCEPAYAYVDPVTFHPVRRESSDAASAPFGPLVRFRRVERNLAFEYLPRTAANVALTDIAAQHPGASR